ncbi:MAG: hypothetical protein J3R72DRAFT_418251 [Linnemannia gamsii]|nr:MAG: hypothetical protein J3R72DRAFT_418251 [Linnemannia gamsii]
MRHPLNWTLGSTVLLSLALLSHLVALGEATRASAIDDLKSNSLYWKRDRLSSPSTNQQASSSSKSHSGSESLLLLRKRSLYAHVDDEVVTPPSSSRPAPLPIVNRRPHLIDTRRHQQGKEGKEGVRVALEMEMTHEKSREPAVETANKIKFDHATHRKINSKHLQEDDKVSETTDKLNFWTEDNDYDDEEEDRTLIEPHYPSIDLFDEEELLEVGEDGILRAAGHYRSSSRSSRSGDDDEDAEDEEEDRHDQVWLVDEWEEELEGDMDEWMDWVEENHTLNRMDNINDGKKDKHRLRDQSAMESLVLDEDEASPFQRLFSESWLF